MDVRQVFDIAEAPGGPVVEPTQLGAREAREFVAVGRQTVAIP